MDHLINETQLEERLARAYRELNMLYEVSCAMRTTLKLDHILYIILTGVTSHSGLGYNRALLFLVNPKTRSLQCEMVIGPESGEHASKIWDYIENSRPKLDDLIQTDKVSTTIAHSSLFKILKEIKFPLQTETSFPLLLVDAYRKESPWHVKSEELVRYAQDPLLQNFKTKELLIMPLRAKGNINGLIVADNIYTQKPITSDDIRIFSMLADQAALAIENSRLYEMTVQKSHSDSITDLWNHGFFQELLSQALEDAKTNNHPLSLLMIDIDNFKTLNDTFGHQKGDAVLTELARILKESSREADYICRYGGEEFSIILKQTGKAQGFEIAERIRSKVQQHNFNSLVNPEIKMTVSIGLAAFREDSQSKEELIANADKAMYVAKFSGKNKTCAATSQN